MTKQRPQSASVPFDARPLTERVDPTAVRVYAAEIRTPTKVGDIVGGSIFTLVTLVLTVGLATAITISIRRSSTPELAFVPTLVVLIGAGGFGLILWLRWRNRRIRSYRLHRFATANNMTYLPQLDNPRLPGMIFHQGHSRVSKDLVRGTRPRFVEFGNYEYRTGLGRYQTIYLYGYVAIKLDVTMPNIVLHAVGNETIFGTNLPFTYQDDQRIVLDGGVGGEFQLYCPDGHQADALYLFTPDILGQLSSNGARLDVEIAGDWLFLYVKRTASRVDAATWAWLFGTVGALITKFDRWEHRPDDPAHPTQGRVLRQDPDAVLRRTKKPFPRVLIWFVVIFAVVVFVPLTISLLLE